MNVEQLAFNDKFNKLITSTQSCVDSMASKCLSKQLITKDLHDKVVFNQGTPGQKARILLSAVHDCMKHKQDCFLTFLTVLEELVIFKDLIEELKTAVLSLKEVQEDQVVPGSADDLFSFGEQAQGEAEVSVVGERRPWKDSGIRDMREEFTDEISSKQEDVMSPFPPPSNVASQLSNDSGYSRGSSHTDSTEPVQETSQSRENSVQVTNPQDRFRNKISSRVRAIDRLQAILLNLRMETMQHEAMEIDLKEEVTKLSVELGDTVKQKEETEEALKKKIEEVENLKRKQSELEVSLTGKQSELEDLKTKFSRVETDKEELRKDIVDLKAELAAVTAEHGVKVKELEDTRLKLKEETQMVGKLRSYIFILERKNSELSYKCTQSVESEQKHEKLKLQLSVEQEEKHQFQRQLSQEQRERRCLERQNLCFVSVIVLFLALAFSFAAQLYI